MSAIIEIIDRLSGITTLKEKLSQQDKVLEGMQRIMLEQQKDIAELKGTLKGILAVQTKLNK